MNQSISRIVKFHDAVRSVVTEVTVPRADEHFEDGKSSREIVETFESNDRTGSAEKLSSLLEEINERLDSMNQSRSQNLRELQEVSVELSVAIAAHILKKTVDANEFQLVELVTSAIEQLQPDQRATIRVNPLDETNLNASTDERLSELRERIDIVQDSDLPRGSCHVDAGEKGLLSTLENRLENIRDTLLQGIEYARTDRRKIDEANESLRRFPDRRKLA